jgi:peptidyl-prolyl cis-trans isomerase A (cyclophilin A)
MFSIQTGGKQVIKLATVLVLAFPAISSGSVVNMQTVLGEIDIELYDTAAPLTVANFMNYVTSGAYNSTFIHRSLPGFVIQGGGYSYADTPFGTAYFHIPTNPPVQNEFSSSRSNVRGTIGMAKPSNNPDGATSEWFINLADNSANLDYQDGGFTVFGRIIVGMDVVDAIANLPILNASAINGAFGTLPVINYNPATGLQTSNLVMMTNVTAVPVPAAAWLFGSGLLGLFGVARRRKIA